MIKRILLIIFALLVSLLIIFLARPSASTSHTFTKGDDAYIAFIKSKDTFIEAIEEDKQVSWRSCSITGSYDNVNYTEARLSIEVFSTKVTDIDSYVESLLTAKNLEIGVDLVIIPFPEKALVSGTILELGENKLHLQSSHDRMIITFNDLTLIEDSMGKQESLSYLHKGQDIEVFTRHEALDENEGSVLAEKIKVIRN